MEHGAIDMIVHRTEMRATISRLLSKFTHTALVPVEVETLPDDEGVPPDSGEVPPDSEE